MLDLWTVISSVLVWARGHRRAEGYASRNSPVTPCEVSRMYQLLSGRAQERQHPLERTRDSPRSVRYPDSVNELCYRAARDSAGSYMRNLDEFIGGEVARHPRMTAPGICSIGDDHRVVASSPSVGLSLLWRERMVS